MRVWRLKKHCCGFKVTDNSRVIILVTVIVGEKCSASKNGEFVREVATILLNDVGDLVREVVAVKLMVMTVQRWCCNVNSDDEDHVRKYNGDYNI